MYERKIPRQYTCGTAVTLEIIGGKWKPALIFSINSGKRRPSELQRMVPDASRRVLNQQLKELEEHGIITKKIYPVLPPKVEYYLTEFGESLLPITKAIDDWGMKYQEKFEALMEERSKKQAESKEELM